MRTPNKIFALLMAGCLMLIHQAVFAQGQLNKALEILSRVQAVYDSNYLSFHMSYTYASEKEPTKIVETVEGDVKLSGKDYYTALGNTVMIKNARYDVTVFKEDTLIMISRPTSRNRLAGNPLDYMGGVLKSKKLVDCMVTTTKEHTEIVFIYAPDAPLKKASIVIDPATNRIQSMCCLLLNPNDPETGVSSDAYVVLTTAFTGYDTVPADSSWFDESGFFERNGSAFKPAKSFEGYRIFVATPHL